MTGLKSDSTLLAVSGRAAANVAFKGDRLEFIDTIGEIQRKNHDAAASPTDVEIRNFGVRSPILYDAKKARSLGWIDQGAEAEGLGDVAVSTPVVGVRPVSDPAALPCGRSTGIQMRILSHRNQDQGRVEACPWVSCAQGRRTQRGYVAQGQQIYRDSGGGGARHHIQRARPTERD